MKTPFMLRRRPIQIVLVYASVLLGGWVANTYFLIRHHLYGLLIIAIPAMLFCVVIIVVQLGLLTTVKSSEAKPFSFLGYQFGDMVRYYELENHETMPRWFVPTGTTYISGIMVVFYSWAINKRLRIRRKEIT